jgi:DNA repair exonuclease SbcCD ATPase subunit
MIIQEIGIRGFKSFGNIEQTIKLNTERGELILLTGSNGNGKSSFIESFEFLLYGKVKSMKKKKWATLSTLPNRINGELQNRIKFISNGTEVEVIRGIGPNILKLIENGVENDRAGKANIDEKIENYVGIDVETFKSFLSMSINDFKNFISLSNDEKQMLLDKLFNLEVINLLNSILKDLVKSNKLQNAKFESEVFTLTDSIQRIENSIQKAIEKEKLNIQSEIDEIKEQIESRKGDYQQLKEKVDKIKVKENELKTELDREREQYSKIGHEIKSAQKDIDLYDSGKCPTCGTDFLTSHFEGLKSSLLEKKESLEKIKSEIEDNMKSIREKQVKLQTISDNTSKSFNDITYLLRGYKTQIERLQLQNVNDPGKSSVNIQEFEKTIQELEEKKTDSVDNQSACKEKESFYKELSKVFGEDGVKKTIIAGIIKPINHFIQMNIAKMCLPFQVKLDETFTAEVKHLGSIIEPDSLSTGEHKLINICILISYLMLIRTKKFINILFLDEVFSSVDLNNIQKILELLKFFANQYKVNIFVVHHAVLNHEMFDKILKINKEVFSSIEELHIQN